jgi:hypothetical protein
MRNVANLITYPTAFRTDEHPQDPNDKTGIDSLLLIPELQSKFLGGRFVEWKGKWVQKE